MIFAHLGIYRCVCPMSPNLTKNTETLCECTDGFEKTVSSDLVGRPVDAVTVESLNRGDKECTIRITL
ncbi:MAG: hypothetical protein ACFNZW_05600 [Coriobacteriaceae bacterium]